MVCAVANYGKSTQAYWEGIASQATTESIVMPCLVLKVVIARNEQSSNSLKECKLRANRAAAPVGKHGPFELLSIWPACDAGV